MAYNVITPFCLLKVPYLIDRDSIYLLTGYEGIPEYTVYKYFIIPKNIRLIVEWSPQKDKDQ